MNEVNRLAEALPRRFDFYHLGQVMQAPLVAAALDPLHLLFETLAEDTKVGYTIRGDLNGVLVISFERGLDLSTYMELGNVIASRMVTELGEKDGLGAVISPPQAISQRALDRMAHSAPSGTVHHKTYLHRQTVGSQTIHAFLIPAAREQLDA